LPPDDQGKDEFLALLGHELRNPLGPVRNAVHILRGRVGTDAQSLWALDLIERQLDELIAVIDGVSEVSRISRGVLKLSRAPFAIGDVVAGAVSASDALVARKQQHCAVSIAQDDARAVGDGTRAEQAVRTLIRCASKSLPTGANIAVDVRIDDDRWTVAIGSRESDAHPASTRSDASVGVTLARKLAEALGGTLVVHAPGTDAIRYELALPRK
jgi:signal transduction histidine kinase